MISPSHIILLPCVPHCCRVGRDYLGVPDVAFYERRGGRYQDRREHGDAEGGDGLECRSHLVVDRQSSVV